MLTQRIKEGKISLPPVPPEVTIMAKAFGLAAALLCLCAMSATAQDAKLTVGSPAPQLDVKEFVKGEPVKQFENGKIYVVEFWATWCPPCVKSIPHLSALQKKHKDVVFIGVSVDKDVSKVKPFVTKMGKQMAYRVAIDKMVKGEGRMSTTWMAAAGQDGIPSAFIVKNGTIAWIGHPMEMDKVLDNLVSGKDPASSNNK
jgi:thiol-disulfide isomerase/thioredoxin